MGQVSDPHTDKDGQSIGSSGRASGGGVTGGGAGAVVGVADDSTIATKEDVEPYSSCGAPDSTAKSIIASNNNSNAIEPQPTNPTTTTATTFNAEQRKLQEMDLGLQEMESEPFNILSVAQERSGTTSAPSTQDPGYHVGTMSNWLSQFNTGHVQDIPDAQPTPSPRPPPTEPGAYTAAPGTTTMDRVDNLDLSLVGAGASPAPPPLFVEGPTPGGTSPNMTYVSTVPEGVDTSAATGGEIPATRNINSGDEEEEDGLMVEATPVESDEFGSRMMEAQPIDQNNLVHMKAAKEAKYQQWKRLGCGFLVLACLVLIVSLVLGLTTTSNDQQQKEPGSLLDYPTASPTRKPLPPPMENLETLYYNGISGKTRESLHNRDSSQYKAWEWLLHHPNITTLEEWRKQQLFAMGTFFYSFDGYNWPEQTRKRWLDYTTNECSWVMTDIQVMFFFRQAVLLAGPDPYSYNDFRSCNDNGQLQNLAFTNIKLTAGAGGGGGGGPQHPRKKPSMPPEIELLTSLKLFAMAVSQLHVTLSEFFVPEFVNLPNLTGVNLYESSLTGTIPHEMFRMSSLRHLLIGGNKFDHTIPTQIGTMTSLEYINLHQLMVEGNTMGGTLPSELGLMKSLTSLDISWAPFTGTIPTELGSLTNMKKLVLDPNQLLGPIPSQLGLLTANTWLALYENQLTGATPTELGLMKNATRLRIWNNALSGPLPSQLGLMTDMVDLRLGNDLELLGPNNDFFGTLPTEVWGLSSLEWLFLPNLPSLDGQVPSELMMPNLTKFSLSGSRHLSGSIPESICLVEELDFDCSDLLCGCDCVCIP